MSEKFTYLERNVLLLLALVDRHLLENVSQPDSQAEALRAMRAAQGARVNAMQGWVRDRDRETTEEFHISKFDSVRLRRRRKATAAP